MIPPGRFLKQDPQTKLWHDIGKKAALAKIRQALREGAPELLMGLETAEHFRQHIANDLVHSVENIAPDVTKNSDEMNATLLNCLPRNESMKSLGSESLLSLGSGTNGTCEIVRNCVNKSNQVTPSLASSSVSSNQEYPDQFTNHLQMHLNHADSVNGYTQAPFQIPTTLNCLNTSPAAAKQTSSCTNDIKSIGENATSASNQNRNDVSSNALMALLAKVNTNNNGGNGLNYKTPSLASSFASSNQEEDSKFQPDQFANQHHVPSYQSDSANGFKQAPFQTLTTLNYLNTSPPSAANQTSLYTNEFKGQLSTVENFTSASNQNQNGVSSDALLALLAKMNANNSIINGNLANQITSRINNHQFQMNTDKHIMTNNDVNQGSQAESGFHSTLLQQLQSQQAYHQLFAQLGMSQTVGDNSHPTRD